MSRKQHPAPGGPGWVYVMTNPSMMGMVKIGMTSRTPSERASELSSATGLPTPFTVAWCAPVSDCHYVEQAVHRMLDDRRVDKTREFFSVDVATARYTIQAASGSYVNMAAAQSYPTLPPRRGKNNAPRSSYKTGRRRRYRILQRISRFAISRLIASILFLGVLWLALMRPHISHEFPFAVRLMLYTIEHVGYTLSVLLS